MSGLMYWMSGFVAALGMVRALEGHNPWFYFFIALAQLGGARAWDRAHQ